MNILFTICGRAGSKGIKNKNIRNFLGAPLPYYTLAAIDLYLDRNKEINGDIVVSTDSNELIELCNVNKFREVNIINRQAKLSGDNIPKIAVILDSLIKMQERMNKTYDMVVDLDITSPLRTIDDLERLIEKQRETHCDVAFSVVAARRNPYFNMVMKKKEGYRRVIESNFNTRQAAPEIFDMNASMYAYSPNYLKSQKGVLDGYSEIIEMYDTAVLDLDHENDFELMEVIAKYLYNTNKNFRIIYKAVMEV